MHKKGSSTILQSRQEQNSLISSARGKTGQTRFMPADKEMQNMYGDALLLWAQKETSVDIDDWFAEKQIGPMKFYNACQDNAYLDECLCVALSTIGMRAKKKLQDSHEYNMKKYPKYDSLCRLEAKQKLKAAQQIQENIELKVDRG